MKSSAKRFPIIDWLRVFAIFLMFIYHFSFDLSEFHFIEPATFNGLILTAIGRFCLCLFMFCVGYSLALSHSDEIHWNSFFRRWIKVALAAGLVSLGTWLTFPAYWIYFGILHNIAVTSILGLLFLRIPFIALISGILIMILYWIWIIYFPFQATPFNIGMALRPSLDHIPLFPWMAPALVGIGIHRFKWHERMNVKSVKWIEWMSQHSLEIYLVHQPFLYGLVYGFYLATNGQLF